MFNPHGQTAIASTSSSPLRLCLKEDPSPSRRRLWGMQKVQPQLVSRSVRRARPRTRPQSFRCRFAGRKPHAWSRARRQHARHCGRQRPSPAIDFNSLTTRQLQAVARNSTFPSHLGINRDLLAEEELVQDAHLDQDEFGQLRKAKARPISYDFSALAQDLAKTGGENFEIQLGGPVAPDLSSANWGKPRKKWFRLSMMMDAKGKPAKPKSASHRDGDEGDAESDAEILSAPVAPVDQAVQNGETETAPNLSDMYAAEPAAKMAADTADAQEEDEGDVDDDYISPPRRGPLKPRGLAARMPKTLVMPSRCKAPSSHPSFDSRIHRTRQSRLPTRTSVRASTCPMVSFCMTPAAACRPCVALSCTAPAALSRCLSPNQEQEERAGVRPSQGRRSRQNCSGAGSGTRGVGRRAAVPTTALFRNHLVQHDDEREGWGWEAGTRVDDMLNPDKTDDSDDDDKPLADIKKQGRSAKRAAKRLAKAKRKRKAARRVRREKRDRRSKKASPSKKLEWRSSARTRTWISAVPPAKRTRPKLTPTRTSGRATMTSAGSMTISQPASCTGKACSTSPRSAMSSASPKRASTARSSSRAAKPRCSRSMERMTRPRSVPTAQQLEPPRSTMTALPLRRVSPRASAISRSATTTRANAWRLSLALTRFGLARWPRDRKRRRESRGGASSGGAEAEAAARQQLEAQAQAKPKKERSLFTLTKKNKKQRANLDVSNPSAMGSTASLAASNAEAISVTSSKRDAATDQLGNSADDPERSLTPVEPPVLALDIGDADDAGEEGVRGRMTPSLLAGEQKAAEEWLIASDNEDGEGKQDSSDDDDVPLAQVKKNVASRPVSLAAGLSLRPNGSGNADSSDEELPLAALKEKRIRQSMLLGGGKLDLDFTSTRDSGSRDGTGAVPSPSASSLRAASARGVAGAGAEVKEEDDDSDEDLPLGQRHPGGNAALAAMRLALEKEKRDKKEARQAQKAQQRAAKLARQVSTGDGDEEDGEQVQTGAKEDESGDDDDDDDSEDDKPLGYVHPQAAIIAEQAALIRQLQMEKEQQQQRAGDSPSGSGFASPSGLDVSLVDDVQPAERDAQHGHDGRHEQHGRHGWHGDAGSTSFGHGAARRWQSDDGCAAVGWHACCVVGPSDGHVDAEGNVDGHGRSSRRIAGLADRRCWRHATASDADDHASADDGIACSRGAHDAECNGDDDGSKGLIDPQLAYAGASRCLGHRHSAWQRVGRQLYRLGPLRPVLL